jgi:hypothetical protein
VSRTRPSTRRRCATRSQARGDDLHVTVVSPVNEPQRGYVVYTDTRRASAQRRLDRRSATCARPASRRRLRRRGGSRGRRRDALAQLEPPVDEILVSTHPRRSRAGCAARPRPDPLGRGLRARRAPRRERRRAEREERPRDRERDRARRAAAGEDPRARQAGPASFLIISPQSDPTAGEHPEAERRLSARSPQLRGEGIDVHGQVAHPDPFSAAMEAVHDERVDEIVVSTFEPLSSGWLRKDLVERLRKETGLPVEHVVARHGGGARHSYVLPRRAAGHDEHEHHGPPDPHYSSRIKPETLGMYLFIASEIMLFGSFFTAYFFVRIVNGVPWPTPPYELPVFVATINTFILMTVERDDALGDRSIKRGNVWGMRAGLLLTFSWASPS